MSQSRQNKEDLDKAAVGAGFLIGALISLGISVEEAILSPFLGDLKGFELIVLIATIVLFLATIMQLVILRGKLFGLCIFFTGFLGGLLIFF